MVHELHRYLALGGVALALTILPDRAHALTDPFVSCSFLPQSPECVGVYERSLLDPSPAASSARFAFEKYARYLTPARTDLTERDRQYLNENEILVPFELNETNRAGLHNVINDLSLKDADRRDAVKAFISHAVRAELYCGLRNCSVEIQVTS